MFTVGADGRCLGWSALHDSVNKKPHTVYDWDPTFYHSTLRTTPGSPAYTIFSALFMISLALAFESLHEKFFAIPAERKTTTIFKVWSGYSPHTSFSASLEQIGSPEVHCTLEHHSKGVSCVSWHPTQPLCVSGSLDSTLSLSQMAFN